MPRKRVITREIDITVCRCLYVNPGKKQQKRITVEVPGSWNPRQIDRKKPLAPDPKLLYVKCLNTKLARARYEMPLSDYLAAAEKKGMVYYGEEKKESETNKDSDGVRETEKEDPGTGKIL